MSNELLWIIFALVQFLLVVIMFKFFGKMGLFVWIGFAIVAANIQVLKTIDLFGMTATLGNIMYATIFLATDAINEFYGKKEAQKSVWMSFLILFAFMLTMQITLMFIPASTDFAQGSLETLFMLIPRIAFASLLAFLISQQLDVYIFDRLKNQNNSKLWVRNNVSTLISQFIDTFIFVFIAMWGVYDIDIFISILITTYIIKALTSILDTPFIYLLKRIK